MTDRPGNKPVRRRGIRNAQQGLRKAQQQDAFFTGETVLCQEGVDPALFVPPGPCRFDQLGRERGDTLAGFAAKTSHADEL